MQMRFPTPMNIDGYVMSAVMSATDLVNTVQSRNLETTDHK